LAANTLLSRSAPRAVPTGFTQSNSRKGTPHDNAAKESFFASLEKERLRQRTFATHEQARSSIFQYIEEFYRGRDAGCPAPPAQIPACASNALGS
jgi:transposase InsO family protein